MSRSIAAVILVAGAACNGGTSQSDDASGAPDPVFPANAPPVGTCESGWCWAYPRPQGESITSLWGANDTNVWALTGRTALHFDGTSWKDDAFPTGCAAWRLWGSGANDVWAIGTCTMHWDGHAWTAMYPGVRSDVIGGLGPTDLWKADSDYDFAWHWDGTDWHDAPIPFTSVVAFGGSGTTTLAVSYQGQIAKWSGSSWGILDASPAHGNNGAVVLDATHVVVAENGAISFWTDGVWTTQTSPVAVNWSAIAATSSSDVWVAGIDASGAQVVDHWNGSNWSAAGPQIAFGSPSAMWLDPSGAPWVGTSSGGVSTWKSDAWIARSAGDDRATATWGTDWDNVWILGNGDSYLIPPDGSPGHMIGDISVMHWNGTAWLDTEFPYLYSDGYRVQAGWGSAPDDVWVAGRRWPENSRMLFHWNGSAWSSSGPFGTETGSSDDVPSNGFTSIWGAASDDIYAVAPTALYHYDGNSWTQVAAVPGGGALFGSSATDVYVLHNSEMWRWDGSQWSWKSMPAALWSGWANSPTDIWLTYFHYDGTEFVAYPATSGQYTGAGPFVGSADDMFMFGDPDEATNVSEWVGGFAGTKTSSSPYLVPQTGWRTPDGHVFVAGATWGGHGGLIVH